MFARGPSVFTRLILVMMASIILMVWDHHRQHLSSVRSGLLAIMTPLEYMVSLPADIVTWASLTFASRGYLLEENGRLRDELLIRRVQTQRLVALESENARLRQLLGSVKRARGRRLVADILSVDSDPLHHIVTVNKGSGDGVYVGQPVLDAFGVMGQIIEVSYFVSQILLISDIDHAIPVKVDRSGFRTIALGTGDHGKLALQHVPHTADVLPGDLLITSGLGQMFPEGYPVAEVVSVVHDPGEAFARIDAATKAQLSRSGQVVLVWPERYLESKNNQPPENPSGQGARVKREVPR